MEGIAMPFEIVKQNDYLLITLSGDCLSEAGVSVAERFRAEMEDSKLKLAVILCSDCGRMDKAFMRELVSIHQHLKSKNGKMRLVGANDQLLQMFQKNGVDQVLVNRLSLRGALADLGLAKAKEFDVNFINPFLSATVKVFKVQCFMELKPQKPRVKSGDEAPLFGDVSGIISVNSETFVGNLAISMSEKTFVAVVKNMLGETVAGITERHVDLVGELANMILGQAKLELATLGYKIDMALPSCVWGKDHQIKHFGSGRCVVLPFETPFGVICSEIMTQSTIDEAKKAA
jgi:chemotaxis protein CheX